MPVQIGFGGWGYTPNQIPHSADELIAFHESLGQVDGRPSPIWFTEVIKLLCADGGWEDSIYEECAMRMSPIYVSGLMRAHIIPGSECDTSLVQEIRVCAIKLCRNR